MDHLVAEYPALVSKVNIGSSFENRPMNVLKVRGGGRQGGLARDASRTQLLPRSRSLQVLSTRTTPAPFLFLPFSLPLPAQADAGLRKRIDARGLMDALAGSSPDGNRAGAEAGERPAINQGGSSSLVFFF